MSDDSTGAARSQRGPKPRPAASEEEASRSWRRWTLWSGWDASGGDLPGEDRSWQRWCWEDGKQKPRQRSRLGCFACGFGVCVGKNAGGGGGDNPKGIFEMLGPAGDGREAAVRSCVAAGQILCSEELTCDWSTMRERGAGRVGQKAAWTPREGERGSGLTWGAEGDGK